MRKGNNGYLENIPKTSKGLINPSDARFYYVRDEHGHPRTTVCLGKTKNGEIVRGVAICSENDVVDKQKGRQLSYIRMNQAKKTSQNKEPISALGRSSVSDFVDNEPNINFKSEGAVKASPFEEDLLKNLD